MKKPLARDSTGKKLVAGARKRTEKVEKDLEVAREELQMANKVLVKPSRRDAAPDELAALAVLQNIAVEEKVSDAVEELKEVTALLKDAEQVVADAERGPVGRSGEGASSVIQHLPDRSKPRG